MLLRQELESNLLHVLTLLEQVSKSEESESESVKYLTFLMHRTTNEKFQKLMCDAIDWSSDKILESFDDFKDDFPVLFDLWSISFEFSVRIFEFGIFGAISTTILLAASVRKASGAPAKSNGEVNDINGRQQKCSHG